MKLTRIIITFLITILFFGFTLANEERSKIDTVTLTPNNVATLRGPIDDASASRFINQLLSLPDQDIYIYLYTPGGGVVAGYQIIETMDMLVDHGKKIHCIADRASSMGFAILQCCQHRYVRQSSLVMQHQFQLHDQGPMEHVIERMRLVQRLYKMLTERQAERLSMTFEDFRQRTLNDWYMFGPDIVSNGVADAMIHVRCDHELLKGHHNETTDGFFVTVEEEYSDCPLIHTPIRSTVHSPFSDSSLIMPLFPQ